MYGYQPPIDILDIIGTFDLDETASLLDAQLESLHDEACETLIDNFKNLYARYKAIRDGDEAVPPEVHDEVQNRFYDICQMFIDHIDTEMGLSFSEEYLADHQGDLPTIALQLYLFFVLDFRSNLFNVLLSYISAHIEDIAPQFEELRQRRDSVTAVNSSMHDQNIALVCSNIYDVVDWVMTQMDGETFFANMEKGYIAYPPVYKLYQENVIDGGFVMAAKDIIKENLSMKGKICFDIICRLKGFDLNV